MNVLRGPARCGHTTLARRCIVAAAALLAAAVSFLAFGAPATVAVQSSPRYGALQYAEEFSGANGGTPNPSTWLRPTGGNGWGNNELESYTARSSNVSLDGRGDLALTARKETYRGTDGITRDYTSGRILSKMPIQYGYLEARIKLPVGPGLWPAFWTVGADIYQVNWPACGEIDVMESVNSMSSASGTIHGPTTSGSSYHRGGQSSPMVSDGAFHIYAIDWKPDSITWYRDGTSYFTVSKSDLTSGQSWQFNKPHLAQFNLAVGGNWPGPPNGSTPFPATMLVDYVRVYKSA